MKGPLKLRPEQDWRSPLPPGDELLVWLMAAGFFDASRIAARDQAAAVKMKKRPRSYTRATFGALGLLARAGRSAAPNLRATRLF
jgi:hypothetical protein